MTDRHAPIRAALDAVPCVKWTASRSTVHIPETDDWAGKALHITGLDKQVARRLARYIADTGPAAIRPLLADADRAASLGAENARLREALRWTAGSLQAACVASKINEADKARALVGTESRTVGQILDAANAALAQEHGGGDAE